MSTADARLLVFGPGDATMNTFRVNELPRLLEPGDVLVVNDAATLPASLPATNGLGIGCRASAAGASRKRRA